MGNNIFEKLKWNKKFVKLSITALIGAISVYGGTSYSAKAMKSTGSAETQKIAVVETENETEELLVNRGRMAYDEGRYDDALVEYEHAVAEFGGMTSVRTLSDLYDWYSREKKALPPASPWRARAMCKLGECCERGIEGVIPKDKKKAFEWYKRAAEEGNANAMCILGVCYEHGMKEVMPPNKKKAVEWYTRAAEKGNADAMCNLGVCYLHGEGVAQDKKKAFKLCQQAAFLGSVNAIYNLGVSYEHGIKGVIPQDKKQAAEWYKKASDCYKRGKGILQDMKKAFELYQRAENLGLEHDKKKIESLSNPSSTSASAGVKKSKPDSATDAEQSKVTHIDQSDTYTFPASELPTTDSTTEEPAAKRKEPEKSIDGEAEFKLGNCLWYGKTVKRNRTEAIEKYKIAANLGNVRAMCKLGDIYMNGEKGFVEKDDVKATEWFRKAAESGDIYAKDMLEVLEATEVEELE